jgi:hypothetical protein
MALTQLEPYMTNSSANYTLANLTVTSNVSVSNITATGNISASYYAGNGSLLTGITAGTSSSKAVALNILFGG